MNLVADPDLRLSELRSRESIYVDAIKASLRLEQLGAGAYYMGRLRNNILLPEPEWDVLKYILKTYPTDSTIVEVGCGWGQLLAMASAVGYTGLGLDMAGGRIEGARYLRDIVDQDFKGTSQRLAFFEAEFPESWGQALDSLEAVKRGPVIGFFSNLGYGATEEYCDARLAAFREFDFVIMDVVRFFANRVELDVQEAFIGKMKGLGIDYVGDIYHRPGAYRFIVLAVDRAKLPAAATDSSRSGPSATDPFGFDLKDPVGAWVSRVRDRGGMVSPLRAVLMERLVRALKDCGAWQRLDRLWVFAAEDQAQALTDLVRCAGASAINDPSFTPNFGYAFDGSKQYIDTGFNPLAGRGNRYSQDSACYGGFVYAAPKRGGVQFGNDYSSYSMLIVRYGNTRRFQVNSATDTSNYNPTNGVFQGHFHGQRSASDRTELFLDGISQGVVGDASRRVRNQKFFVGAGSGSGGPSNFSDASISTAHIGGCFQSTEEVHRFDEVMRSYLRHVGTIKST